MGGSGTISGAVSVADGGTLAAGNSPGHLTVGSLILNNASVLDFELAAPTGMAGVDSDLITVTGDLTLDGILNVTDLGGFDFGLSPGDSGRYVLINYGAALTDNTLEFGTGLLAGYNYTIDTTLGQVALDVDYTGLQFWDGGDSSADDTVDGGSGTWAAATSNWTSESGNLNRAWNDLTAVFSGSAGTVEVDGTHTVSGLQFATDGYTLSDVDSNGSIELAAAGVEARVDEDVAAMVAVTLSGSGALSKTGAGSLTLTADNSYSGGTTISGGTLTIGSGGTSGSIAGNITNHGLLRFNRSDSVTFAGDIGGSGSVGLLSGTTRFSGDLSGLSGTLSVDGSTLSVVDGETLSLGGDYSQAADATFRSGVSAPDSFGILSVAGTATFTSEASIDVDVADVNSLAIGDTLTGVISAGTLNASTYSVTDDSASFYFFPAIEGDRVDLLVLNGTPVFDSVTSANFQSGLDAARVLDTLFDAGMSGSDTDNLVIALGQQANAQAVSAAVAETLPLLVGGGPRVAASVMHSVNREIGKRHRAGCGRASGTDYLTDCEVWLKPIGSWSDQEHRDGVDGFDADSHGLVGGIDVELENGYRVGLALSYIDSEVRGRGLASGNTTDIEAYQTALYGSHSSVNDPGFEFDWQIDIGRNVTDSHRNITFIDRTAKADYGSDTTHIGLGVGYRLVQSRGVAIFAEACFGHPSPSKRQILNATVYAYGAPFARALNYEYADGVDYRGLTAFASLSMAVSAKRPALSLASGWIMPTSVMMNIPKRVPGR
ncbi:hypothetical protein BOW53_04995 [Solemya pervernicosa gill symbiont]|uniref:Autotransporter domain-containing protein n=1 Tax=Solemya pervernicosa gill symbiont TaxID=642797 RepID=A0A1T2L7M8_9GAMM|nr:autotransporter outer membrane beta-barrel domain-containing protein [Solemya pervernicosa gill symbiont]OOZ41091.1 hypothetical protein BOW53_04995 [Solemya pervernicosa gill symbiont]